MKYPKIRELKEAVVSLVNSGIYVEIPQGTSCAV